MPPKGKSGAKKNLPKAPLGGEKKKKVQRNPLFEKTPRNYRIGGDIQPKRNLAKFVKWPLYVQLQRKKRILLQRMKVPPSLAQFTATLDKSRSEAGVALGVDVELSDDEAFLTVVRITGGVVAAWNAMHPDKQLKLGDRIVAVNGLSGDGALMTHLVQSADLVELFVQSRVDA